MGHRLRRWIGDKPDRYARYTFPLYSPAGMRAVMLAGWRTRAHAAFHAAIARRARLPLDDSAFRRGTDWTARAPTPTEMGAPPLPSKAV